MKKETKDYIKRAAYTWFQLFVFVFVSVNIAYFLSLFYLHPLINMVFSLLVAVIFHNLVFENKKREVSKDEG